MKIMVTLFMAWLAFSNHLLAQRSVPDQIKKGKWMISHDVFRMGYETETIKTHLNNAYTGKEEYDGFHTSLIFQSPSWGGLYASTSDLDNTNAAGTKIGGYKRSNYSFTFRPSAGRFISDRLLLGAELLLYLSKDKSDFQGQNSREENTINYTSLGIGPHIRYYFGQLRRHQLFHAGLSGGINYKTVKQDYSANGTSPARFKTKQPEYYAEPYLGSSWFVGKHWTFGASLSYRMESYTHTVTYNNSNTISTTRKNSTYGDISLDVSAHFTF